MRVIFVRRNALRGRGVSKLKVERQVIREIKRKYIKSESGKETN
jgi:hypothetical protein